MNDVRFTSMTAIAVAAVLLFATTGQYAFGDNLQADALASSTLSVTIEEGETTSVEYWLVANGADGCNVDATNAATVTLTVPAGLTASQNPFTLTQCKVGPNNNGVTITFTGDAAGGPYDVPVASITGGKSGNNGYLDNQADDLEITVTEAPTPEDTTAPTSNASLNPSSPDGDNDWYVSDVEVTLSATDNSGGSGVKEITYELDGGATQTISGSSGSFTVSTDGTHTVTFRAEDNNGNVESPDSTVSFKIDQTNPSTSASLSPASPDGDGGWYVSDVLVTLTGSDATSGVASTTYEIDGGSTETYSAPFTVATDGTHTITFRSTDNAGNEETEQSEDFKIDQTAPVTSASLSPASPDGDNDWYVSDVEVTLSVDDGSGSDVATTTYEIDAGSTQTYSGPFTVSADGSHTVTFRSTDNAGNIESPDGSTTFKIDQTTPTISGSASPAANSDGWNNEDVTVAFDCDDETSGIASCEGDTTLTSETAATGTTVTGTATDNAGNQETAEVGPIKIDKTDPTNIQFTDGGLTDGENYYFGFVPDGPTECTADDALSGLDHCTVDGTNGGKSVGSHSYLATAVDNADNEATDTLDYTVNAWTIKGFYQPVDMSPNAPTEIVWNTLKGGQTAPLKFEIFADTEFTSTTFNNTPIGTFKTQKVSCNTDASPQEDPMEITTTGGTSFRYDATAGQFVQNWQTTKSMAGSCFTATFTAQDGSFLTAYFKVK